MKIPPNMYLNKVSVTVIAVTVFAIILRFAALNIHSLWWDELQSVRTADPSNSFSQLLQVCKQSADPAPRTFYFILNIWFRIFGYNDVTARAFTAIFGVAAIPVMYFLGKQLGNKHAGIIAAVITSVNYWHIYYSLDVRFYSLLFFFSALSYLFFVRSLQQNSFYNLSVYAISTLLLMILHYFGILVFVTQALTWFILNRKTLLPNFKNHARLLLTFLLVLLIYLPFIGGLLQTLKTETAALSGNPGNYFFINYFTSFFGFSGITVVPAAIALMFFVLASFLLDNKIKPTVSLILCIWILLSPAIAYTRTLFSNPTMGERYFIIVLPGIIAALSLGIMSITNATLRNGFIAFYATACIISLTGEHKFYSTTSKDDFRGVVNFIKSKENAPNFEVLSDKNWHFKYYFDQNKLKPVYIDLKNYSDSRFYMSKDLYSEEKLISDTTINRFWIISAHFANLEKMKSLCNSLIASGHFIAIDSFESKDAFARLLARKNPNEKFSYYSIPIADDQLVDHDGAKVLPIWSGEVVLNTLMLPKGRYQISILSKGSAAAGVYAHMNLFINNMKIGDYVTTREFELKNFRFEVKEESVAIKLQMDNDLYDPAKNEDRNEFVRSIILNKEE